VLIGICHAFTHHSFFHHVGIAFPSARLSGCVRNIPMILEPIRNRFQLTLLANTAHVGGLSEFVDHDSIMLRFKNSFAKEFLRES